MKEIITKCAPNAIGPYVQGYVVSEFVYTSGQLPVNPDTGKIPNNISAQAEQTCKNISAILKASGSDLEHVFKTTCYLSDMENFQSFNEVYSRYFICKPARSCIAVKELPLGALCEIEAIAKLP